MRKQISMKQINHQTQHEDAENQSKKNTLIYFASQSFTHRSSNLNISAPYFSQSNYHIQSLQYFHGFHKLEMLYNLQLSYEIAIALLNENYQYSVLLQKCVFLLWLIAVLFNGEDNAILQVLLSFFYHQNHLSTSRLTQGIHQRTHLQTKFMNQLEFQCFKDQSKFALFYKILALCKEEVRFFSQLSSQLKSLSFAHFSIFKPTIEVECTEGQNQLIPRLEDCLLTLNVLQNQQNHHIWFVFYCRFSQYGGDSFCWSLQQIKPFQCF